MQIDAISFAYGACVAVIPTVMAMVGAVFLDELRHKEKDDD